MRVFGWVGLGWVGLGFSLCCCLVSTLLFRHRQWSHVPYLLIQREPGSCAPTNAIQPLPPSRVATRSCRQRYSWNDSKYATPLNVQQTMASALCHPHRSRSGSQKAIKSILIGDISPASIGSVIKLSTLLSMSGWAQCLQEESHGLQLPGATASHRLQVPGTTALCRLQHPGTTVPHTRPSAQL